MILEIFDVEHGACALIATSNGKHVMIDCGHNGTSGWKPGGALRRRGITSIYELIVTNYDEDHVSGINDLLTTVSVQFLRRNTGVTSATIRHLKSEDGMGSGIETLVYAIDNIFNGGSPSAIADEYGDVSFMTFRNNYGFPPNGFNDENNLSLVTFVHCGGHTFLFPGDMEKAGWQALLRNPIFVQYLSRVTFFVASHHGSLNGYCEDALKHCPHVIAFLISDKGMGYESQETVPLYRAYARGFLCDGGIRHVLTTRKDGCIRIELLLGSNLANVSLGAYA